MIIPDNEIIVYKTSNELKKPIFYRQSFIISLVPCGFIACLYVFLRALNPIGYFTFVFVFYIILAIVSANQLYKGYNRFFGTDEIAFSKTKVYFNVCMNLSGRNTNVDGSRYLSEINDVYVRKGWNPKTLVIYFSDGSHIAVHSLKSVVEVEDYIKSLPLAKISK